MMNRILRSWLDRAAQKFDRGIDPMLAHQLPEVGPWFEGWYTRIVDSSKSLSFGVITTTALRTGERLTAEGGSGYVAVIIQEPKIGKTISFEAYPKKTSIGNLSSDFSWSARDFGTASTKETQIQIFSDAKLHVRLKERVAWSGTNVNLGPEGALAYVEKFPLHWHVWNTGGKAEYELEFSYKGESFRYQGEGLIHQEKNWGAVFPPYWMWAQAMNKTAYFSLAGGDLEFGPTKLRAYLVGYRSEKYSVDFHPAQWIGDQFSNEIDACERTFKFSAENLKFRLEVDLAASPESFADLSIPTLQGYMPNGAVESFQAHAETRLYRAGSKAKTWDLIETVSFDQAGLEFGGLAQICRD